MLEKTEDQDEKNELTYYNLFENFPLEKSISLVKKYKIKEFSLYGRRFEEGQSIPDEFWELSHLEKLHFDDFYIGSGFSSFLNFENLTTLSFYDCSFDNIPLALFTLKYIKNLRFKGCGSIQIPEQLGNLISLEDLDIRECQITNLPSSIGDLTKLGSLNLKGNNLNKIPIQIEQLKFLKYLNLTDNSFEDFPAEVCLIKSLKTFSLNHFNNDKFKLKSIPPEIGNLTNLQALFLRNNEIQFLPKEFASLRKLREIELDGNPLTQMPEAREMGYAELFRYLDELNGTGFFSTIWEVPNSLSTAFQQYLNAFTDFVFGLKEVRIKFNAVKIDKGLELTTEATNGLPIEEINQLLEAYFNQSAKIEELKEITRQQKAKIDTINITWQNDRSNFLNKIQLLNSTNQLLAASLGNLSAIINQPEEVSFNTPLFNDPRPRSTHVNYGQNINVNVSLQLAESTTKSIDVNFYPEKLLDNIIECLKVQCGRKLSHKDEDLHNDNLTDLLRAKGYNITDQTRHGGARKKAGELDLMVRNNSGDSLAIIEGFKATSAGSKDKNITSHINKLLQKHGYDPAGHEVNFIVVYAEVANFQKFWESYREYMDDLSNKPDFDNTYELKHFRDTGRGKLTNIRVGKAMHVREGKDVLIYHIVSDMHCPPAKDVAPQKKPVSKDAK